MVKHDYNVFFYAIKKYQSINPDFSNCLDLRYADAIGSNIKESRDRARLYLENMPKDERVLENNDCEKYKEIIRINNEALHKLEVSKQRFIKANSELRDEEKCIKQMLSGLDSLINSWDMSVEARGKAYKFKQYLDRQFNGKLDTNLSPLNSNQLYIDIFARTEKFDFVKENLSLNESITKEENKYYFLDRRDSILFPHIPQLSDVNQGAMGNCYLVACIAGIVEKAPEYIQKMMRDNGDGTVTVKLYGKFGKTNNDKAIDDREYETYIRMSKVTTTRNAKGPLWLSMLEKAFTHFKAASGGFSVSKAGSVESGNISYVSQGGNLSDIFYIITGNYRNVSFNDYNKKLAMKVNRLSNYISFTNIALDCKMDSLDQKMESDDFSKQLFKLLVKKKGILLGNESVETSTTLDLSNGLISSLAGKAELIAALYKINMDDVAELEKSINGMKKPYRRRFNSLSAKEKDEFLFRLCKYLKMHRQNMVSYIDDLTDENLYNRPLTGKYSDRCMEVYNNLAEELNSNKVITTAGLAIERDELQETNVGGIYLNHAYTVLGLEEHSFKDSRGKDIVCRFIKLRNPWGRAYMTYKYDKDDPTKIVKYQSKVGMDGTETKGVTLLELNDYVRLFTKYTVSEIY